MTAMKLMFIVGVSAFLRMKDDPLITVDDKTLKDLPDHDCSDVTCTDDLMKVCEFKRNAAAKNEEECAKSGKPNPDVMCKQSDLMYSEPVSTECMEDQATRCKKECADEEGLMGIPLEVPLVGSVDGSKTGACKACRAVCDQDMQGHQYDCRRGCCSDHGPAAIADGLADKVETEAEKMWKMCNKDGNEHMTEEEVARCLEHDFKFDLGHADINKAFATCMFEGHDEDKNGLVTFDEFANAFEDAFKSCITKVVGSMHKGGDHDAGSDDGKAGSNNAGEVKGVDGWDGKPRGGEKGGGKGKNLFLSKF